MRSIHNTIKTITVLAILVSTEAFFLKWGSDNSQQSIAKTWPQIAPQTPYNPYRTFIYAPYPEQQRKPAYQQIQPVHDAPIAPSNYASQMQAFPISVPAGSKLTPVSLQHVQLVPCMCPVAPEEADKLQETLGQGPYLAQSNYLSAPQQSDQQKPSGKQ